MTAESAALFFVLGVIAAVLCFGPEFLSRGRDLREYIARAQRAEEKLEERLRSEVVHRLEEGRKAARGKR